MRFRFESGTRVLGLRFGFGSRVFGSECRLYASLRGFRVQMSAAFRTQGFQLG